MKEACLIIQTIQFPALLPKSSYNVLMASNTRKRIIWTVVLILILALTSFLTIKTVRSVSLAQRISADLDRLRATPLSLPESQSELNELSNEFNNLRGDLVLLKHELTPIFPLTKTLGWLPRYSEEVTHAEEFLEMGIVLSDTAIAALQAASPAVALVNVPNPAALAAGLPSVLAESKPFLADAHASYQTYLDLRSTIDLNRMDPFTRPYISKMDDLQPLLTSSLELTAELPALLGFSNAEPIATTFAGELDNTSGAKYLLIFQNEDELRATGGFVTAIGTITLRDGEPNLGTFNDSPAADDFKHIYPPPPFWLEEYMGADYLLLRDANWEIDFPQAALSLSQLYGFYDPDPLSGVIAMDQMAIVELLRVTGPITVPGFDQPISSENLIQQLRLAKQADASRFGGINGDRKAFLEPIALELLNTLLINPQNSFEMEQLVKTATRALEQKHILISVFSPAAAQIAQLYGWDGAVQLPPNHDGLMVVDSNIGFNKTNALVNRSSLYTVDLTDPQTPLAELMVTHTHSGVSEQPCQQWGANNPQSLHEYPMERCYYNYLRVVTPAGSGLIESQTHDVSGLLFGRYVPAQVDPLPERLEGGQIWGTLMALPGMSSLTNEFRYSLPAGIITSIPIPTKLSPDLSTDLLESVFSSSAPAEDGYAKNYQLDLFKQPGHHPESFTLILRLPPGAELISALSQPELNPPSIQSDPASGQITLEWQFSLLSDTSFSFIYR